MGQSCDSMCHLCDDVSPLCHCNTQVLSWYRSAHVTEGLVPLPLNSAPGHEPIPPAHDDVDVVPDMLAMTFTARHPALVCVWPHRIWSPAIAQFISTCVVMVSLTWYICTCGVLDTIYMPWVGWTASWDSSASHTYTRFFLHRTIPKGQISEGDENYQYAL